MAEFSALWGVLVFFFSSRRRHTRCSRDWSSDVCSSDLIVVPRSDVRVADWPVDGDPVFQVGFEIEIAPAVALPSPGDGLAADLAAANPGKMFSRIEGVGIFLVVYEKLDRKSTRLNSSHGYI